MSDHDSDPQARAKARMAEIGPRFDGEILEATRALYAPYADLSMPEGSEQRNDVPYGDDPRQRLDLYLAAPGGAGPLVVYVPGGGFTGGDKAAYRNIGAWLARNGVTTVVINYRLAPAAPWPAGPQDIGRALSWIAGHAADLKREAGPVVLFGQSAGATHVAGYLSGHGGQVAGVSSAILMNGFYEMLPEHRAAPYLVQYFGDDPALYPARSPINGVVASKVPISLYVAEYDPPMLATPTFDLASRLTRRDGRSPPTHWLEGHNHVSPVMAIGTPGDEVGPMILKSLRALA